MRKITSEYGIACCAAGNAERSYSVYSVLLPQHNNMYIVLTEDLSGL
jgi:hypothetical protein